MIGSPWLELPLPRIMGDNTTLRGAWMDNSIASLKLVRLIASGQLNLRKRQINTFSLDQINDTLHHTAVDRRPLKLTVVVRALANRHRIANAYREYKHECGDASSR